MEFLTYENYKELNNQPLNEKDFNYLYKKAKAFINSFLNGELNEVNQEKEQERLQIAVIEVINILKNFDSVGMKSSETVGKWSVHYNTGEDLQNKINNVLLVLLDNLEDKNGNLLNGFKPVDFCWGV